jgi:hypothetical protein
VLNITNIPALTDIKSNFHIYGKARVLEDDKAGQYREGQESANSGLKMFKIV